MMAMESRRTAGLFRQQMVVVLGLVVLLIAMFLAAAPAVADVSVSRAEVSGTNLRVEGTATASRDITVDGVVMGRSGSDGRFRIERSGYTAPADCTVDVNDGSATPRTATLSGCTVSSPPPPSALVIDDRPLPNGNVGTDYGNFVTATGGSGAIRWSIAAGALPAGLALTDFAPSSGLISGRPTTVQTSTFTVRATDGAGNTATRQFSITINAARPLVITSPSQLPAGTVGTAYAVGVFADGGTTPYSWTRTAGTLPPGLALQASPGRIQGTPTTAGTFSFTLRVADSAGQSATGTFSITINAPAPAPQPPQAAPTLVSPAEGASVVTPFTISWQAVSDPQGITHYNWQLGTTSAFTTMATAGTVAGDVTQASVSPTLASGTYFWRVQAVNADGTGPYSAARSVSVTGTTNPSVLTGVSVNPANVTGGSSATGSVSISPAAPAAGAVVTLASSQPDVAALPSSITVPAGQTSATFAVTTQPVTSSFTVVITATLGEERFAFLSVGPAAPPPAADTVAIQRAQYDARKRALTVEATSTNSSAVLRVFRTSTDAEIGTMSNQGGGRYRATFSNVANPENVTVKSNLGGSATRAVSLK
jgi:Putative Ig domain